MALFLFSRGHPLFEKKALKVFSVLLWAEKWGVNPDNHRSEYQIPPENTPFSINMPVNEEIIGAMVSLVE